MCLKLDFFPRFIFFAVFLCEKPFMNHSELTIECIKKIWNIVVWQHCILLRIDLAFKSEFSISIENSKNSNSALDSVSDSCYEFIIIIIIIYS